MPMMIMTTRSSMRVKPPSRSSCALRIRASIAVPPGRNEGTAQVGVAPPLRGSSGEVPSEAARLSRRALRVPCLCDPASRRVCRCSAVRLNDERIFGQCKAHLYRSPLYLLRRRRPVRTRRKGGPVGTALSTCLLLYGWLRQRSAGAGAVLEAVLRRVLPVLLVTLCVGDTEAP